MLQLSTPSYRMSAPSSKCQPLTSTFQTAKIGTYLKLKYINLYHQYKAHVNVSNDQFSCYFNAISAIKSGKNYNVYHNS